MRVRYIKALNDVNGNPRRGWVIPTPSGEVFIDEGYAGRSAIYEWLGEGQKDPWRFGQEIYWSYFCETIDHVKVREYMAYKRSARQ